MDVSRIKRQQKHVEQQIKKEPEYAAPKTTSARTLAVNNLFKKLHESKWHQHEKGLTKEESAKLNIKKIAYENPNECEVCMEGDKKRGACPHVFLWPYVS